MQDPLTLRPECANDWEAIHRLVFEAFLDHPHHPPGSQPMEHHLVSRLRKEGALVLSLVAELESEVVGHIAFSPITFADGCPGWLGLGPLAVAPARQGQGVGSRLVREALGRLRGENVAGLVVLGEPAYYGRFGFAADSRIQFPGPPPEYFQRLHWHGPHPQGEVHYHPAFSLEGPE